MMGFPRMSGVRGSDVNFQVAIRNTNEFIEFAFFHDVPNYLSVPSGRCMGQLLRAGSRDWSHTGSYRYLSP